MTNTKYRILCLFPAPVQSHTTVFFALTDALADRGHELVIATVFPKQDTRPNVRYIDWSDVEKAWIESQEFITNFSRHGMRTMVKHMSKAFEQIFIKAITNPEIQDLMKHPEKERFDLVICEVGMCALYKLAEIYKAPLIAISSSDPQKLDHEIMGNLVHYLAAPLRAAAIDTTKFKERFEALRKDLWVQILFKIYFKPNNLSKKYLGEDFEGWEKLFSLVDMLFINVHPATGIIRPLVPKTIPLGFVHVKPAKPLPDALEKYFNESKHGVVYCSLGTQVRTLSLVSQISTLFKAFERLKYDVIFKSDTDTIDDCPANVRVEKWLPQNDLLAHKNLKLFITQAGQHSMEEAIYHGVPMLALPIFGDQPLNARRIAEKGIGEYLFLAETTPAVLSSTIEKIVENKWYRENVVNWSRIVQDQPMTSLEKAVWWTEYTVRHKGAKHLEYPGLKVPTYQYYYLDVGAAVFGILVACILVLYLITRLVCSLV